MPDPLCCGSGPRAPTPASTCCTRAGAVFEHAQPGRGGAYAPALICVSGDTLSSRRRGAGGGFIVEELQDCAVERQPNCAPLRPVRVRARRYWRSSAFTGRSRQHGCRPNWPSPGPPRRQPHPAPIHGAATVHRSGARVDRRRTGMTNTTDVKPSDARKLCALAAGSLAICALMVVGTGGQRDADAGRHRPALPERWPQSLGCQPCSS